MGNSSLIARKRARWLTGSPQHHSSQMLQSSHSDMGKFPVTVSRFRLLRTDMLVAGVIQSLFHLLKNRYSMNVSIGY